MLRRAGALILAVAAVACGGARPTAPEIARPAPVASASSPPLRPAKPPTRAHLKPKDLCTLPPGLLAEALPGTHPFARADAPGDEKDPFMDRAKRAPAGDVCFVSDDNMARDEASRPRSDGQVDRLSHASAPGAPHASPLYLDRVTEHLHLNDPERALLDANGFVALDRVEYESYATAYHDIFQQQLPAFISIDSVLNSVFQSNGSILELTEGTDLYPRLVRMLTRLQKTLSSSVGRYGDETAHDLDVYLGVATTLLGDTRKPGGASYETLPALPASALRDAADDAAVTALVGKADEAQLALVTIFGRDRMIDFSQLTPRGHYAGGGWMSPIPQLGGYFRAMMWLSRFEWNLVSRSCRSSAPLPIDASETPREARDAMALADLVSRAGELDDLRAFDRVYTVFAGKREDVSVPDLLQLMATSHLTPDAVDAPARLRAAIGDRFARTARVHFMPEGSTTLPAIATLFGPRIVPDTAPLTRLVRDGVPERDSIHAADVAFVLGHDRATRYLADDLATFPTLRAALGDARAELTKGLAGKKDLYSLWLSAVAHLADARTGSVPRFAHTEAYQDFSMNSAIVGYGQIRHNYVLVAAQGYDSYGCEIPDGYVEPALGTYDALLAYAREAKAMVGKEPTSQAYWKRVVQVLGMLRSIVVTELSGARLSEAQRRWLGMVAEYIPTGGYADSGAPPKWTGWYFDLFPDRHHSAERTPAFVADYFTLTNAGKVAYVGAERPRMGVFLIDVNGEPRVMVGPVAKGYEVKAPLATRLDDEKAYTVTGKQAAWLSYLAPDVPLPSIEVSQATCGDDERVALSSGDGGGSLGELTVALLDHHGDPLTGPLTAVVGAEPTLFTFHLGHTLATASHAAEGMHVWVHDLAAAGLGHGRADVTYGVRVYSFSGPYGTDPPLRHPFQEFSRRRFAGPGGPPAMWP